jgi:hypothetical protein
MPYTTTDILMARASSGAYSPSARTDFHVYFNPYNGAGTPQLTAAGYPYYRALGLNFTQTHYQVAGSNQYNQSPPGYAVETQVQTFWTSATYYPTHTPQMDLWWFDTESSFYTGLAANAATDLAGAQNAVNWTNLYWDSYTANPVYVGNYGNATGIRTNGIIGYPWNKSVVDYETSQNDNNVNGQYVADVWDWMGPELYQGKLDEFACGLDWICNEKARLGITTPLIPFIWCRGSPSTITTYDGTYARLEYAYSRPECNGLHLWNDVTTAGAPTQTAYDSQDWMQAAVDFCADRGITAGTPF